MDRSSVIKRPRHHVSCQTRLNDLAPLPQSTFYEGEARILNLDLRLAREMRFRSTSYAHFQPAFTHAFNCVQLKDNGILTKPIYGTCAYTCEGIFLCQPAAFSVLTTRLLLNRPGLWNERRIILMHFGRLVPNEHP